MACILIENTILMVALDRGICIENLVTNFWLNLLHVLIEVINRLYLWNVSFSPGAEWNQARVFVVLTQNLI